MTKKDLKEVEELLKAFLIRNNLHKIYRKRFPEVKPQDTEEILNP